MIDPIIVLDPWGNANKINDAIMEFSRYGYDVHNGSYVRTSITDLEDFIDDVVEEPTQADCAEACEVIVKFLLKHGVDQEEPVIILIHW